MFEKPNRFCSRERTSAKDAVITNLTIEYAAMAQQVEHVLGKDEVTGSSPVSSSKIDKACKRLVDLLFTYYFFTLHLSILESNK